MGWQRGDGFDRTRNNAVTVDLGQVDHRRLPEVASIQLGWTTISVFLSGSRNQNIGGTGPPRRAISASTSTFRDLKYSCVASMSSVVRLTPVWTPTWSSCC